MRSRDEVELIVDVRCPPNSSRLVHACSPFPALRFYPIFDDKRMRSTALPICAGARVRFSESKRLVCSRSRLPRTTHGGNVDEGKVMESECIDSKDYAEKLISDSPLDLPSRSSGAARRLRRWERQASVHFDPPRTKEAKYTTVQLNKVQQWPLRQRSVCLVYEAYIPHNITEHMPSRSTYIPAKKTHRYMMTRERSRSTMVHFIPPPSKNLS